MRLLGFGFGSWGAGFRVPGSGLGFKTDIKWGLLGGLSDHRLTLDWHWIGIVATATATSLLLF